MGTIGIYVACLAAIAQAGSDNPLAIPPPPSLGIFGHGGRPPSWPTR